MARTRILLADDERGITTLLKIFFEGEGYEFCCCFTGREAFEKIKETQPDIVLLDLQMEHRESGLEVLRWMRSDDGTKDIPAIMYSADVRYLRLRQQELLAYNCQVIEKPFDLEVMLELIEQAVHTPLREREA